MKSFKKVAIIGSGLIGGSLGIDIKRMGLAKEVVGISRHKETILKAKKIKAIDKGGHDLNLIKDADLIILAAPVDIILRQIPRIFSIAKKDCIIFDVGSTKQKIVELVEKNKNMAINFVGTHPLAGAEKRGIDNARRNLFQNSLCILTPTRHTEKNTLNLVNALWKRVGAKTIILSPGEHDKILAYISHLPHLLAFSLINSVPEAFLKFGASGLKDTTRIAASSADLWQAIFLTNKSEILKALEKFEKSISLIKTIIKNKDIGQLNKFLTLAKQKRDSLG